MKEYQEEFEADIEDALRNAIKNLKRLGIAEKDTPPIVGRWLKEFIDGAKRS